MFLNHRYIADESGQGLLTSKKKYIPILNTLPNPDIRKELHDIWLADDEENANIKYRKLSGAKRWVQLKDATSGSGNNEQDGSNQKKRNRVNYHELEAWRVELVLKYCYPRLGKILIKIMSV